MLESNPKRIHQPFIALDAWVVQLQDVPLHALSSVISGPVMQQAGQLWPMYEGSFISRTEQAGQLYPHGY